MSTLHFTQDGLRRLQSAAKPYWRHDDETAGFCVRVMPSGTKTYYARSTIKAGESRSIKLGRFGEPDELGVITLKDARAAALRLLAQMRDGVDPQPSKHTDKPSGPTFGDAFTYWIDNGEARAHTKTEAKRIVEQWLTDWLPRPMTTITRVEVRDRYQHIMATIQQRRGTPGGASANLVFNWLQLVWNLYYFDHEDKIATLPCPALVLKRKGRRYRKKGKKKIKFSAAQWRALGDGLAKLEVLHRSYLELLLLGGMRTRETCKITRAMVKDDRIELPAAITKANRDHAVPITAAIRAALDRLAPLYALPAYVDNPYVLPSVYARSGHFTSGKFACRKLKAACGLKLSPHDFRRLFASACEAAGVIGTTRKELMNHSTESDVTEGYVGLSDEDRLAALARVDEKIVALLAGK